MDHRILELEPFDAVGLRCECPGGDTSAIGPLWDRFFYGGGAPVAGSHGIVGVSWGDGAGGFSYMAAHKVAAGQGETAAATAANGYESRAVPGGRYIGVEWQGHGGEEMSGAFRELFANTIPAAGLKPASDGVCIEDYPHDAHDPVTNTLKAELLVKVD